jgi:hypothetical protein
MRLNLLMALMDLLIVLAYPFVYILGKLRQLFGIKR